MTIPGVHRNKVQGLGFRGFDAVHHKDMFQILRWTLQVVAPEAGFVQMRPVGFNRNPADPLDLDHGKPDKKSG